MRSDSLFFWLFSLRGILSWLCMSRKDHSSSQAALSVQDSAEGLVTTSPLCPFRSGPGYKFLLLATVITSSFVASPYPAYIFANSSLLNSPWNIQFEWTVCFQTGLRLIYTLFLHISIGIRSFSFYRDLLVFIHMVSNYRYIRANLQTSMAQVKMRNIHSR